MELELGLKLTNVADEFTPDFQLAKDRAGPVFVSRETDAVFILTAHLKGYRIPSGVILDEINARVKDDESTLTITMPKKVKGVVGSGIEEVKDKPGSGSLHIKEEEKNERAAGDLQACMFLMKECPCAVVEPRGEGEGGEEKAGGFRCWFDATSDVCHPDYQK